MEHRFEALNHKGFFARLWLTIVLLVFAALAGPLLVLGVAAAQPPWFQMILRHGLEVLAVFYAVLVVYVWWRPPWLAAIYSSLETKLLRTGQVLGGMAILASALTLLYLWISGLLR
jgi:hypothetical protein